MDRSIFEPIIDDPGPQDRVVVRVNWPRVAFALLPATMILLALGFKAGQMISSAPSLATEAPSAAATEAPSAVATEAPSAPKAESTLQLAAEPASQGADSGSPIPLGIFVSGRSELASAATVEIIGLPRGALLSAGRSLGDRWRIPAARLSNAAILLPRHFSGALDLEVELRLADDTLMERQSVRRAITDTVLATEETVLPLGKAERDRSGARAAEFGNAQAPLLLAKAERLLAEGEISGARLLLRRAAELGNVRSALLLGEMHEASANADAATAATWYKMAADLGSAEARQRLDRLATGDRPSR
jgi:hypothetical protein